MAQAHGGRRAAILGPVPLYTVGVRWERNAHPLAHKGTPAGSSLTTNALLPDPTRVGHVMVDPADARVVPPNRPVM